MRVFACVEEARNGEEKRERRLVGEGGGRKKKEKEDGIEEEGKKRKGRGIRRFGDEEGRRQRYENRDRDR